MTLYGIDISHYQSSLNVATAKEQGFSFLMTKVTEGTGYYDPTYTKFRDAAKAEKLLFAAYHYLRSDSSGDRQAAWCASKLGDKTIPVMVDMESGSGGSVPKMIHCTDFIKGLAVRGVKATLLYLPEWYWAQIGKPSLPDIPLVSSKYGNNGSGYASALYPGDSSPRWSAYGGRTPTILQFGSNGKYSGYSGSVDINAYRGTLAQLQALSIFKDYGAATPPIVSAPSVPTDWTDKMIANLPTVGVGSTQTGLVRSIQGLLLARGHSVVIDGDYGPATKAAVLAYQNRVVTEVRNGTVGAETWVALIMARDAI